MKKRLLVLPLAAMLLAGCGETPNPNPGPDEPTPGPVVPTKVLASIEVATQPTKVNYKEGETFDPTGMVVNAVYDDGSKEAITDYQISNQALVVGVNTISITYNGKTASITVTVEAVQKYNITFIDQNGDVIKTEQVAEGKIPTCDYRVVDTEHIHLVFEGWSLKEDGEIIATLPEVAEDATYYAVVKYSFKNKVIDFTGCSTALDIAKLTAKSLKDIFDEYKQIGSGSEYLLIGGEVFYAYSSYRVYRSFKQNGISISSLKEELNAVYSKVCNIRYDIDVITNDIKLKERKRALKDLVNIVCDVQDLNSNVKTIIDEGKSTLLALIDNYVPSSKSYRAEPASLEDEVKTFFNSIKVEAMKEIGSSLLSFKQAIIDTVSTLFTPIYNAIDSTSSFKQTLSEAFNGFKNSLGNIEDFYGMIISSETLKEDIVNKIENIKTQVIEEIEELIRNEVDILVNKFTSFITNDDIKEDINDFKTAELDKILAIKSIDDAKTLLETVKDDCATFITNEIVVIKSICLLKIDGKLNQYIELLDDGEVKSAIQKIKTDEIELLNDIHSVDDLASYYSEFLTRVESIAKNIIDAFIKDTKDDAKEAIDALYNKISSAIDDETVVNGAKEIADSAKLAIDDIETLSDIKTVLPKLLSETKATLQNIIEAKLTEMKNEALNRLDNVLKPTIQKIDNEQDKNKLLGDWETARSSLEAIDDIETFKDEAPSIVANLAQSIAEVIGSKYDAIREKVSALLNQIKTDINVKVSDYLPEKMRPGSVLTDASKLEYDLEKGVNVLDLQIGYGEQWNMVLETMDKVQSSMKFLNSLETLISDPIQTICGMMSDPLNTNFNLAIPANEYVEGGVTYSEATNVVSYNATSLKDIVTPFGTVKPSLKFINDGDNKIRTVVAKFSDTNKIKYVIKENKIEVAMVYGVDQLSKTTHVTVENNEGVYTGTIVDHTVGSVAGKTVDFDGYAEFITDGDYLYAVGDKADAIFGMEGYIVEIYDLNTGKLLGYKIQESKTIISVTKDYHTLWFNLKDISGINKVRVEELSEAHKKESPRSTCDVYLNSSDTVMDVKYNTLVKKTSRYYDIELRMQYFYVQDKDTGEITKVEVETPMMFIQDDNAVDNAGSDTNFTDTPTQFKKLNGFDISVNFNELDDLRTAYKEMVPAYKTNVESIETASDISNWIDLD